MANKKDKENHYKDIINKQKAIIKKLAKQAARGNKIEDRFYELEEKAAELLMKEESKNFKSIQKENKCPKCNSELDIIDSPKVKVIICQNCNYRTTKRK